MAVKHIRLCWACHDIMEEAYKLSEVQDPELKRCRCQGTGCKANGYFSLFTYDESRPKRDIEGAE